MREHVLRSDYCVMSFLSLYFPGNVWDTGMCGSWTLLIQGDPWHVFAKTNNQISVDWSNYLNWAKSMAFNTYHGYN